MVRSEVVSTPTKKKKKSKSLEVRKSKCSKSKEKSSATNSSATGISKRKKKSNKKAAVVDDGCTGGLKLLKRHTVTMASLTKAQVLKDPLEVELDQHGDPLEANGSNLQSYTGVLARTKVPINIESWPKVGKLLKNTIWDTILIKMGIPEEDIDRTLLWIKGHQGKNGEFRDEALMIVNERITPEHTGRVRGVGGYVACPNQYFSLPKRRKQSVTQSTRLSVRQIMFEEQKKMEERLKEKIAAEEREKIVAEEREKIVAEEKEKLTEEIREKILKEETEKIKAAQDAYWEDCDCYRRRQEK
ncbi:hypothetical protein ACLB2K_055626 [Fragaria x ananassa]